jgi:DNA-binding CsgD family transcriptional regulator
VSYVSLAMAERGDDLVDGPLLGMWRAATLASCAAAGFVCVAAFVSGGAAGTARREITGLVVIGANVLVYCWHARVLRSQLRAGWPAVCWSAFGAAMLWLEGGKDSPYIAGISGQLAWTWGAAAVLSGGYLAGLALRGAWGSDPLAGANAAAPFVLAGVLGGVQWWFAQFVREPRVRGAAGRAPFAALDWPGRAPSRAVAMIEGPGLPAGAGVRERVAALSERQREIYRLAAQGLRRKEVALAMHMSESEIYRERRAALDVAQARTHSQLAAMVLHVDYVREGGEHA